MSIFHWLSKMLGIDSSNINNNLPSEFQLPTENIDDRMHNFECMQEIINPLQENTDVIRLSFDNILRQLDLEFSNNEDVNANIFNEYSTFDKPSNIEEYNNVPKKNFIARNYFLKPSQAPRTLSEHPVSVPMFPGLNFGQSSSKSYIAGNWNGKMIEKEISTKRLQDGNTEKVIVMKDGNQKCITTITENSKTRKQNYTKQLINLDESQLEEFENRFSKLR